MAKSTSIPQARPAAKKASQLDKVEALLKRPDGASIAELMRVAQASAVLLHLAGPADTSSLGHPVQPSRRR